MTPFPSFLQEGRRAQRRAAVCLRSHSLHRGRSPVDKAPALTVTANAGLQEQGIGLLTGPRAWGFVIKVRSAPKGVGVTSPHSALCTPYLFQVEGCLTL